MKRDKKAFTFIETVISLSLLAIIFIGFAKVSQVGMSSVYKTNQEIIATNLARGLMTEIMSKKFDENDALPWTAPVSLGPEASPAETRHGATRFDDVDDYHNYAEPIPPLTIGNQVMDYYSGFSRSVSVKYVTAAMQDSVVTATDYKKVEVTVNASGIPSFKLTEVKASQ